MLGHISKNWLIYLVILVFSFILFANSLKGDFVYDDLLVLPRADLHSFSSLPHLFVSPYHLDFPESGIYRPLTLSSFVINFVFFGSNTTSFHVFNILLHSVNALLLFLLIKKLSFSQRLASVSALLFMTLTIHVEAVTSIVGRGELLMSIFFILALLYRQRAILGCLFFILSLFSKETAIALLPMLGLMFITIDGISLKKTLYKLVPYVLTFGVYCIFRYLALGQYIFSNNADRVYNPIKFLAFPVSLWTAFKVFYLYIQKIFVPYNLSSDYSFNQIKSVASLFSDYQAILGLLIFTLLLFVGIWSLKKNKLVSLGIALFIFPYFIISNLLYKTGTIMAERLMYLPSMGVVILMALALEYLLKQGANIRQLGYVVLAIILIFFSVYTIQRNRVWLTQEALSKDAYVKSPDSVLTKLGMAQVESAHGNNEEAKKLLLEANNLYDKDVEVLNLLGVVYWAQKDYVQAELYFNKVLALRPKYFDALVNLSRVYYREHKYNEAIAVLSSIAEQQHQNAGIGNIMLLYYLQDIAGKYEDVLALSQNLNLNSDDLDFLVGYAYLKKGDIQSAQRLMGTLSIFDINQRLKAIGEDY